MKEDQIEIKKIKIKHLEEFARRSLNDPAFKEVAPISIIRAKSQAKNPQGEPDDIALLLALHKNRCVGYHGILPGFLKSKDHVSKIYWLVTFYLHAGSRGKGYGKQLVREIQKTNVDLVTTGITEAAAGVYRSAGFQQLAELPYMRLHPENRKTLNDIVEKLKPRKNEFKSRLVNQLAEDIPTAKSRPDSSVSFQRDIKTINWMIQNPWVVSKPDAKEDVKQYYFSRVRDLFKFKSFEIYAADGKTPKGYLVLSVSSKKSRTTIKVLDYFFFDPEDIYIAGYFAARYGRDYDADRLEFSAELANFFGSRTDLVPMLKKKKRLYLFYPNNRKSPLSELAGKIKLSYCDSDTAFT